tara:strand:+ start:346 stop:1077 length:732 start_codon:yes stop_codon:yes gene_type:complete
MKFVPDHQLTFSNDQLKRWGILKIAKKESIVDHFIEEIEKPNDEIKKSIIENWLRKEGLQSNESLKKWQNYHELNQIEWEEYLIREWCWERWCKLKFKSLVPSYYLKRKDFLDKVSYSIIRVKTKHLANELFIRIKEKEARFFDIASKYSEGEEKHVGGFIGPVPMSTPHPALARLLQVSKPGQLWAPKIINSWWVIVRLEKLLNTELNESISKKLSLELGEKYVLDLLNSSLTNGLTDIIKN